MYSNESACLISETDMHTVLNRNWLRTAKRSAEYALTRVPLLKTPYWQHAPSYYRWKIIHKMDHTPPIEPLKIVWVDPDEISRISGRVDRSKYRYQDIGSIKEGDWDKLPLHRNDTERDHPIKESFSSEEYVENTVFFKSFKRHFQENKEWEDTILFQRVHKAFNNGVSIFRNPQNKKDIENRFKEIDRLYKRINRLGFIPQYELVNQYGLKHKHISYLDIIADEITIDIGRDGQLLFVDGRHRLIIAKILNIQEVPVTILTRHTNWLNKRSRTYSSKKAIETNHPDLAEISLFSGSWKPFPVINPN